MAMKRWIEKDVTFKGNPPWLGSKNQSGAANTPERHPGLRHCASQLPLRGQFSSCPSSLRMAATACPATAYPATAYPATACPASPGFLIIAFPSRDLNRAKPEAK